MKGDCERVSKRVRVGKHGLACVHLMKRGGSGRPACLTFTPLVKKALTHFNSIQAREREGLWENMHASARSPATAGCLVTESLSLSAQSKRHCAR